MTYDELTEEQKADFQKYDTYLRGVLRELSKLATKADPMQWNAFAQARIDTLLASLDATSAVPNSTGLAQARDLTVTQFRDLQALARTLVTILNDNRGLIIDAIGVNAPSEV